LEEAMTEWTVDQPTVLDIDERVRELDVRIVAGHVDVVPSDGDSARIEVTELDGEPLIVSVVDGRLTIWHERLSWDGVLGWVRRGHERRRAVVSVAVPISCAANIGVVGANAVVAGLEGRVAVRCVSGDVVLDEVRGEVDINSVSGDIEGRGLAGGLTMRTVSGELTLVGGVGDSVSAKSISGDVALDLQPRDRVDVDVSTVSGDVTVRLPGDMGMRVDVSSMSGDLASAFDGLAVRRVPGSCRLSGSIGNGSSAFHGRTLSGRVALVRR
jgi:hypothetical protein